ncbi:MAG: pentapeptide repeat-containing protein [Anaerolineae bacterium]
MANEEHVRILKLGADDWNEWRGKHPDIKPELDRTDLIGANLRSVDLHGANLQNTDLRHAALNDANLRGVYLDFADLHRADLSGAILNSAHLVGADLTSADLSGATLIRASLRQTKSKGVDLSNADLSDADFYIADLRQAKVCDAILHNANLEGAILNEADFTGADLSGCHVFGVSTWRVNLKNTIQANLVITPRNEVAITVDNLEIAQFVYILLNNTKVRGIIDTLTTKTVLILGRFSDERKRVLDAIREELRRRGFVPIMFDFEPSQNRDLDETINTLARLCRFVIADITQAKSIPQELKGIVESMPSLAVAPIILDGEFEYAMFEHFRRYNWVLPVYRYESEDQLIASLADKVIDPAVAKVEEMKKHE